jgi:hypothetical protein
MLLCSRNARPRCMRAVRAQQPLSFFFSGSGKLCPTRHCSFTTLLPSLLVHVSSRGAVQ